MPKSKGPKSGPVFFDLDAEGNADAFAGGHPHPADAPPVPETMPEMEPSGHAMQSVAALAARRPSVLARLFWGLLLSLLTFVISVAAWGFVTDLLAANPVLGWIATGLGASFVTVLAVIAVREFATLARLKRIDGIKAAAAEVTDLTAARALTARLTALYAGRADMRWGQDRLAEASADVFDADAQLALAETALLAPLDARATREVEAAARQVATVTALVPLALADVVAALAANLRMIRRIAEIYGGRGGVLGNWRLTRSVLTHLVATGAVAVGDDLISSVAGGGLLSKVSRRFGEGIVNGALTARVGVAAIEVCRPLPFVAQSRPSVSGVVGRALTGLFGSKAEG
jgi:putative membrane protein